ncbi:MAG: zinc-ribbon domain-containing protein [Anaerolineales bacterium]|nr:MAG: zinc-ribbon domain-containing protein [Anaerolineales bacterium]
MSLGTYLIGAALILLIAAYVGSPLRGMKFEAEKVIEQWVSDARIRLEKVPHVSIVENKADLVTRNEVVDVEQINFCPQCGRRVEVDHRFCPGCGTPLPKGAAK